MAKRTHGWADMALNGADPDSAFVRCQVCEINLGRAQTLREAVRLSMAHMLLVAKNRGHNANCSPMCEGDHAPSEGASW
jgi:hypothetical protein